MDIEKMSVAESNKNRVGKGVATEKYLSTKYSDEKCQLAYQILAEGKTVTEVMCELRISKRTFYAWKEVHPEFSNSIEAGMIAGEAKWRQIQRENLDNVDFRESMFNKYMSSVYNVTSSHKHDMKFTSDLSQNLDKIIKALNTCDIDYKQAIEMSEFMLKSATLKEHTALSDKLKLLEERINEKDASK